MDSIPQSYETNTQNASRHPLEELKNGPIKGCWPECLPSITEEREEQSIEENNPLSGLGTNVKTQIVDDRSIRPGVGKRQKNMGKSFEDLKIDTSRIDMQYQDSNEAEITDPNSFLEYPEDIHNKDESWSESRKESNSDCDDEEMVSEKESELSFNWSKHSQQWHEQLSDVKTQVDGKNDSSSSGSKEHSGIFFSGSTISKIPIWFMEGLGDDVSQATGKSSLDVSDFQNIEWEQPNPEDHSSKFQINQGTQRIGQCKNKCNVEADECSDTKLERSPGFKKINDQIINVTSKPEKKQGMTLAKLQMKYHNNANPGKRWNGKSSSNDSFCIFTDNNLPCPPYLTRCGLHRASNRGKDEELSDADYATDEPSEAEDYFLKAVENHFPRNSVLRNS
ncbi:hypothetical protein E2320_022805 [Naja naja]|nr:hypothetical protein E2320_022805 [Naja naja]